jgi:hypothetical protein
MNNSGYVAFAFSQGQESGYEGAVRVSAPRRLAVVIEAMSQRTVGEGRRRGWYPAAKTEDPRFFLAASIRDEIDDGPNGRLHAARPEHDANGVQKTLFGGLDRFRRKVGKPRIRRKFCKVAGQIEVVCHNVSFVVSQKISCPIAADRSTQRNGLVGSLGPGAWVGCGPTGPIGW